MDSYVPAYNDYIKCHIIQEKNHEVRYDKRQTKLK